MLSNVEKIQNCVFPKNYLYDVENFVWVKPENDINQDKIGNILPDGHQYVTMGITPILSYLAGNIIKTKLKPVGEYIEKEKSLGSIESTTYFGVIRSPIAGKIVEINEKVLNAPKILNDSPLETGWVAKLLVTENLNNVSSLNKIETCKEQLLSQVKQFNVKCFKIYPDFQMFEFGTECSKTLVKMSELVENKMHVGQVVRLVSDDPTADLELTRWSETNNQEIVEIIMEKKEMGENGKNNGGYFFNILVKKLG